MKTLYLIRHAKSSWKHLDLTDYNRPLKKSGITDAQLMAGKLSAKKISLDAVYTSPAIRAIDTALLFSRKLNFPINQISINSDIYESNKDELFIVLTTIPANYNEVAMFGHDPSLSSLASFLLKQSIDKIPTSGIVCITLNIAKWDQLKKAKAKLSFFYFPKESIKPTKAK